MKEELRQRVVHRERDEEEEGIRGVDAGGLDDHGCEGGVVHAMRAAERRSHAAAVQHQAGDDEKGD